MNYVMEMSTDQDIKDTRVSDVWGNIQQRYSYDKITPYNLNINSPATIIVIAHGGRDLIGNKDDSLDIDASTFLANVQFNMNGNTAPEAVYISTCGDGIAGFAAAVYAAAKANNIWHETKIYGHSDPVDGPVPAPGDLRWVQIF